MSKERLYTVSSVEGPTAHLVDEAGRTVSVGMHLLPRGADGGIVIRVSVGADGTHDWATSTADVAETARRRSSRHEVHDAGPEQEMSVDDVT